MPVVVRPETDMFRLLPLYKRVILVNLTNCVGAWGKGLAEEFKKRYPKAYEEYQQAYLRNELAIGQLTFHQHDDNTLIVNLPTKRHWIDASKLSDVVVGLEALRKVVLQYPNHTVISALPGTGLGQLGTKEVYPEVLRTLDDLPNLVNICVHPTKLRRYPQYLGLVGPRDFTDSEYVRFGLSDVLLDWDIDLTRPLSHYFDGIVTSDDSGVDEIARQIADEKGIKKIIIRADPEKDGHMSNILRGPIIADIATHMIAFTHAKSMSVDNIIACVRKWNDHLEIPCPKELRVINVEHRMKRPVAQ